MHLALDNKVHKSGVLLRLLNHWQLNIFDKAEKVFIKLIVILVHPKFTVKDNFSLKLEFSALEQQLECAQETFEDCVLNRLLQARFQFLIVVVFKSFID